MAKTGTALWLYVTLDHWNSLNVSHLSVNFLHQVLVISVSVFSEDTLHTNHARTCLCLKVKRSVSVRRFSEGCLICFSASSPINFCVTPSRFPNRGRSHSSKRC